MGKDQGKSCDRARVGKRSRLLVPALLLAIALFAMLDFFDGETDRAVATSEIESNIHDRVLVNKVTYHFRQPTRLK